MTENTRTKRQMCPLCPIFTNEPLHGKETQYINNYGTVYKVCKLLRMN